MLTPITAKLAAVDHRLKSLDPHAYSRWLLVPSGAVIAVLMPSLFGPGGSALVHYAWPLSALLVTFSFVGIGTVSRTRHARFAKIGLLLIHVVAVAFFVAPIVFFVWFSAVMSDH